MEEIKRLFNRIINPLGALGFLLFSLYNHNFSLICFSSFIFLANVLDPFTEKVLEFVRTPQKRTTLVLTKFLFLVVLLVLSISFEAIEANNVFYGVLIFFLGVFGKKIIDIYLDEVFPNFIN